MLPAALQTLPMVAFHSRTRPSFPAEDRTVLNRFVLAVTTEEIWGQETNPVMFHSTRPIADLQ